MSKHTPGPWEMRRDGFVYSVATGERVCSPHSTLPDSKKVSEQLKDLKCNAFLIAAAPDLLAALKMALPTLQTLKFEADCSYGSNFSRTRAETNRRNYEAAVDAIAKAEGKK